MIKQLNKFRIFITFAVYHRAMREILNRSCLDFSICVEKYKEHQRNKIRKETQIKFYTVIVAPMLM